MAIAVLAGCTIKASGEMSIMQKWDRRAGQTQTTVVDKEAVETK